ncbi:hypothetical protein JCM16358_19690 [Halanaerocella petrolearia]
MFLTDEFAELSIGMVNKKLKKMEESEPEKYDESLEMILLLTEIATHFLKESKEFREAFAEIHAEFLKYPESRQVIEESIATFKRNED